MKANQAFNTAIESFFYDKEIFNYEKIISKDDHGGNIFEKGNLKISFFGNLRIINFEVSNQTYGLKKEADVAITTSKNIDINMNELIECQGVDYQTTEIIKYDTHILIGAKKWN